MVYAAKIAINQTVSAFCNNYYFLATLFRNKLRNQNVFWKPDSG